MSRFIKRYNDFRGVPGLRLHKAVPSELYKLAPSKLFNEKYIDGRIELNIEEMKAVFWADKNFAR